MKSIYMPILCAALLFTLSTAAYALTYSAIISDIGSPAAGFVNEPFNLWAQAKNTGTSNLSEDCLVRFWVRGDDIDGYVGERPCDASDYGPNTGPLQTKEKRWYLCNWTPNQTGTYKVYAVVEYNGTQIGSWSSGESFRIESPYKAKVASLYYPGRGLAGEDMDLWAKVENTGELDLEGDCVISFWVRGPDVDGIVDTVSCRERERGRDRDLESGELRWYKIEWEPDEAGTYSYYAIVENDGVWISSWSSGQRFYVDSPYEADVLETARTDRVRLGRDIDMWAYVKNTGDEDLEDDCEVRFYVRGPGVDDYVCETDCDVDEERDDKNSDLNVGEKRWYLCRWEPEDYGTYRYYAIVENDGKQISDWSSASVFNVV